jgi:hypothetical protein
MNPKSLMTTLMSSLLLIALTAGAIALFSSASRAPTAAGSMTPSSQAAESFATATPVPISTEPPIPTPSPTTISTPTIEPTIRFQEGYAVTDTTPGGITVLSKHEIIVVPNPVKSAPAEWKIYQDPFYTYTVAYPPEWFLTAPPPNAIEAAKAAGAKQVLGLGIMINSVDTSKAPGTETVTLNPQDSLGIEITVDDYPKKPQETLKEWMTQPYDRVAPEVITSIEETDFKGLPALFVHHGSLAPGYEKAAHLSIYIAAKDGRVFRVTAAPDPQNTIYFDTFKQILDSFTILEK